ncbi:hypothetical protein J2W57_003257 [Chryseobacterium ginsenosidimutans]|uniref:Uncharacterized protein n=1 Tax=Chryseobacterium geocarposphaerae TaxID=1416776 RepID=A0ABU1LCL9_9FLAO|nr:hypothetical protein [Chryseobacterium geocarposphaerae]MDR6699854.1 hypothetical protein [Chryseobacterium ginsenosidimutans]
MSFFEIEMNSQITKNEKTDHTTENKVHFHHSNIQKNGA